MSQANPRPAKQAKLLGIFPVREIGEVTPGDEIGRVLVDALKKSRFRIRDHDIIVVTHKIVSKAEGRIADVETVIPSKFSVRAGKHVGKDPRQVEVILSETRRLVKMVKGLIISETPQGFVCANAGVDQSNVEKGKLVLLPKNPDASARAIRKSVRRELGRNVAVIVSDTFGRPWREGQVDVAIGLSGMDPFRDYRGMTDQYGYELVASVICAADELASAAELCMNKLDRVPAVVIRGYEYKDADLSARIVARKPTRDLFR